MFAANRNAVFDSWWWQMVACSYKMFDLVKYPRIADRSASNHNTIYAIAVLIFQCFFRAVDVAVTYNGDGYTRIVFHLADQCPVGFALIHLRAGSPVNGQ